jgi:hypothetical protein
MPTQISADRDAADVLLNHARGAMATLAIGAAARLGLADAIADVGQDVADLATHFDVPPERLVRLLRALTSLGLCVQQDAQRFSLTGAGELLRARHPQSLHAYLLLCSHPVMLQPWSRLENSIRTGGAAFDEVFGVPAFSYLAVRPELSAIFNAAMSQGTRHSIATLLDHYDFGRFRSVTDVGGGDATLIAAILDRHPNLTGVVFDTGAGVGQAAETLDFHGVSGRCSIVAGDFFDSVPAGADLYVLKSVIHNWDDERAAVILRNCREAMANGGTVLIIDPVLPDSAVASDAAENPYLVDLNMLVICAGKERTRADFAQLCNAAGLSIVDVHDVPSDVGFGLIETVAK